MVIYTHIYAEGVFFVGLGWENTVHPSQWEALDFAFPTNQILAFFYPSHKYNVAICPATRNIIEFWAKLTYHDPYQIPWRGFFCGFGFPEPETPVSACRSRLQCTIFSRPINKPPFILSEPSRTPDFENQGLGMLRAPLGGKYRVVLYGKSGRSMRIFVMLC